MFQHRWTIQRLEFAEVMVFYLCMYGMVQRLLQPEPYSYATSIVLNSMTTCDKNTSITCTAKAQLNMAAVRTYQSAATVVCWLHESRAWSDCYSQLHTC